MTKDRYFEFGYPAYFRDFLDYAFKLCEWTTNDPNAITRTEMIACGYCDPHFVLRMSYGYSPGRAGPYQ